MKRKRWKPEKGEMYWYVWHDGNACWGNFMGVLDERRFKLGNCFKTEAKAKAAAEKVKALLLSLHGDGENLQHNELPKLTAEVFDRPDCPEWAQYAAVDKYRNAMWYEGEPKVVGSVFWNSQRGQIQEIPGKFDASDWQNSLVERPASKLPDWCKTGAWIYTSSEQYLRINGVSIDLQKIELSNGAIWSKQDIIDEAVSARLRPYNEEEMRGLVGKVVCGTEGKTFLVVAYSPNTVLFGEFLHTPEDLTLDIYKFPDGSPCGKLEHKEGDDWVE